MVIQTKNTIKFFIFLLILALVVFATWFFDIPSLLDAETVDSFVLSYGAMAPVIFIGLKTVVVALFLPGIPLTIAGGALFGPVWGTVYVVVAATLGASISFFITRFLAHGFVHSIIERRFKTIYQYTMKARKKGFLITLLLRLVQIFPFSVLNMGLGLTRIRFKDFFFGTLLGLIPGSIIYTWLGDSLLTAQFENSVLALALLIVLWLLGLGLADHSRHSNYLK